MNSFDFGNSFERGLDDMVRWIPNLIGAILILIVGYFIAKIVEKAVVKGLQALRFDRHLMRGHAKDVLSHVTDKPSGFVGSIVFWLLFLGAFSLAVTKLGIPALTAFVASIYSYLPHVIAAVIIFIVAAIISGAVSGLVARSMGDTPTGKVVASVAPILIMTIASFMILTELQIAEQIVYITYTALLGAIALGLALAFGLGGRDAAARLLTVAEESAKQNADQIKADVAKGKQSVKADAADAKDRADKHVDGA